MLLASAGSDVLSQLERFKESFLWAAAKGGRVEECESLLQMGTDVNWISPEGDTPLLAACRNGHIPAALCLLNNGAEVDLAAGDGQTALHFCCRHGNEAIAEALILRGASVLARDNRGATAFESPGPHVPAGMLRRLNIVAQRRQGHDGAGPVSISSGASTSTPETSVSDMQPFRHLNARSGNNAMSGNNAISGSEDSRSGSRSSGHQERPMDTAADSAWSLRSAALHGGRGDSPREEGRTTFPSIAPSVATSHRTSQQSGPPRPEEIPTPRYSTRGPSERGVRRGVNPSVASHNLAMHRHASREGEALRKAGGTGMQHLAAISRGESSCEGFQSSDDDDENELFEVGMGSRLLGGACLGSNTRQRGSPGRNRRERNLFPENMRLISAGDPVPNASAAIAAAIASSAASPPGTVDPAYLTTSETLVSPARQSLDATPRGGTGSNGSGSGRGNRDSHDNRDNGGGGDGSVGDRGTGAAASHTQTPSMSTSGLLYGSTSTINAATAAVGGAGSTRVAEGGVGGGELMERFGSGGAPVTCLGSHDSAEDRGGIRGRGLNSLGEGSGVHDHTRSPPGAGEQVELIRMLWLQEKESRLAAEAKAEAVRDQSARLWNELVRSEKQVLSLEEAVANAQKERDMLKATLRGHGLKGRSLKELEQLEKDFRNALEGVCGERDRIVQGQLAKEEQRLCVVCQENERGVLLLPCRHLCVCRSCSERQELTLCPLCRDNIAESLVVYS